MPVKKRVKDLHLSQKQRINCRVHWNVSTVQNKGGQRGRIGGKTTGREAQIHMLSVATSARAHCKATI